MYCPICGSSLGLIEDHSKTLFRDFKKAELYRCTRGKVGSGTPCFDYDYPLISHGILGNYQTVSDYDTRPGDSWSLTWIK